MLLTFNSCETIVDVNLPEHTPVLVANSFFNPDSVWQVRLFKSKGILERGTFQTISNATVEIIDEHDMAIPLVHTIDGTYRAPTNTTPRIGSTYFLNASAPGFHPIEASDDVPEPVQVDSVDVYITSIPFKLTIHFSDPPEEKNYYQILVLSPEANSSKILFPVWFESDDLLFQNLDGIDADAAFFDDSFISGKNYSLKLRVYPFQVQPIRQMYVVLVSLTESHYRYMKSIEFQANNGDNPFSTPVQVYNNIENGLGIFAGFSYSILAVFK